MEYTLHCLGFTVHCVPDLQLPLCFVLSVFSPLLLVKETAQTLDPSWFKRRRGGWAKIGYANWDRVQKDTRVSGMLRNCPEGVTGPLEARVWLWAHLRRLHLGPEVRDGCATVQQDLQTSRDCAQWTVESQKWPAYPENERSYTIFCWAWDPYNLHRDLGVSYTGCPTSQSQTSWSQIEFNWTKEN